MSTTHFSENGSDSDVRHAKSDAPTEREFERLLQASHRLDGPQALEARFVLLCGGRLGMRPGEIAHFRADWIDWHDGVLNVPAHSR